MKKDRNIKCFEAESDVAEMLELAQERGVILREGLQRATCMRFTPHCTIAPGPSCWGFRHWLGRFAIRLATNNLQTIGKNIQKGVDTPRPSAKLLVSEAKSR